MISSRPFPSYAQYNEDIILLALLHDVDKGFYVDVGANYPVIDSVTKLFYEKGWRGINIEPIPSIFKLLQGDRPEDINLNVGIGDKNGKVEFYENETVPGHSSFINDKAGYFKNDKISKYLVDIKTLKSIFKTNKVKKINFLKIDVEGFEEAVINGNDWTVYRPEIICIESGHKEASWQKVLLNNKYRLFINDGLNEYYVAEESWARTDNFEERVVKLTHRSLKKHQYDCLLNNIRQLKKVTRLNQIHFDLVQQLRAENKMSLSNVSYYERLRRSAYGLTVDWLRYKLSKRRSNK